MPRSFCIPGIIFLFCAFALLFIVSVSLPYLTALDITRVHFNGKVSTSSATESLTQLRFGIWAFCDQTTSDGDMACIRTGHGYSVTVTGGSNSSVTIGSSWTRGLAIHPVATAVAFVALLLSCSTHITVTLLASIVSFVAALITLIAFAIDIALYAFVKHEMKKLVDVSPNTVTGPGFWLVFASFILLILASCTVCFGRRRDRMSNATSYPSTQRPGLFGRFRRNRR
jgi:hypothetical protein